MQEFFCRMHNADFTGSYRVGCGAKCWFKMTLVKWIRQLFPPQSATSKPPKLVLINC